MPASQPPSTAPQATAEAVQPAVVLDTNAVLDWLVFGDPGMAPWAAAIEAGHWRWLACARMRDELAHVLGRPPLSSRQGAAVDALLARFDALSVPCPSPAVLPIPRLRCTDPDDQVFLDLALEQGAAVLISKDRAVLKLARRARALGLRIARPAEASPADGVG